MLFRTHDKMSHMFFAIFESEMTAKISLPNMWAQARLVSPDQLVACADRAISRSQRLMVIVEDKDYQKVINETAFAWTECNTEKVIRWVLKWFGDKKP